jgi:hypothetical protein
VTDPDGAQLDEYLVGSWLVEFHLGDLERRLGAARQGGFDPHRLMPMN